MNIFFAIWEKLFYLPIFFTSNFFYSLLKDFGLVIFCLTVLVKIILSPLSFYSLTTQKKLKKIQSMVEEIKRKFKENSKEKTKQLISLYQKEKINPFSGMILFLQIPILIAFYKVVLDGTKIYSNQSLFGIFNLSLPNVWLSFLASVSQFFFSNISSPKNLLNYFFPLLTFFILSKLPSALAFYWMIFNLLSSLEYYYVGKRRS